MKKISVWLLILLLLLLSCHKSVNHEGIVVGHEWTPAYVIYGFINDSNGNMIPNNIYVDDEYYLKVLDHDTIYTTRVDPIFYGKVNSGDSISYMR
jgi:hypothetical protein